MLPEIQKLFGILEEKRLSGQKVKPVQESERVKDPQLAEALTVHRTPPRYRTILANTETNDGRAGN